jgi:hypothetical protein
MRRLIPALRLAGYEIIDLSQPSWLATAENIELLANRILSLGLGPDSVLMIEPFGNSTFRYRQFDDTMALPFKSGHGYHMEGEVGVCDDSTFGRLINAVRPVFDACGTSTKIIVPSLPRYLYAGCCTNKKHCTSMSDPEYEIKLLHATMRFRPLLKDMLLSAGIENFYVLDRIGSLLGVNAGDNRGPASENVRELGKYCAADGVLFTELGYANMAKEVSSAIDRMRAGTLTKAKTGSGNISGKGGQYFWRGFTSPNGHSGIRGQPAPANSAPASSTSLPAHNANQLNNNTPGFTRGGSRGSPIRGYPRAFKGGRRPPYWKKSM